MLRCSKTCSTRNNVMRRRGTTHVTQSGLNVARITTITHPRLSIVTPTTSTSTRTTSRTGVELSGTCIRHVHGCTYKHATIKYTSHTNEPRSCIKDSYITQSTPSNRLHGVATTTITTPTNTKSTDESDENDDTKHTETAPRDPAVLRRELELAELFAADAGKRPAARLATEFAPRCAETNNNVNSKQQRNSPSSRKVINDVTRRRMKRSETDTIHGHSTEPATLISSTTSLSSTTITDEDKYGATMHEINIVDDDQGTPFDTLTSDDLWFLKRTRKDEELFRNQNPRNLPRFIGTMDNSPGPWAVYPPASPQNTPGTDNNTKLPTWFNAVVNTITTNAVTEPTSSNVNNGSQYATAATTSDSSPSLDVLDESDILRSTKNTNNTGNKRDFSNTPTVNNIGNNDDGLNSTKSTTFPDPGVEALGVHAKTHLDNGSHDIENIDPGMQQLSLRDLSCFERRDLYSSQFEEVSQLLLDLPSFDVESVDKLVDDWLASYKTHTQDAMLLLTLSYVELGRMDKVLDCLDRFKYYGFVPNAESLRHIIRVTSKMPDVDPRQVMAFFDQLVLTRANPGPMVYTSLIRMFASRRMVTAAERLFKIAVTEGHIFELALQTALLSAYAEEGDYIGAINVFKTIQFPDMVCINYVLFALSKSNQLTALTEATDFLRTNRDHTRIAPECLGSRAGVVGKPTVYSYRALMTACYKMGKHTLLQDYFRIMLNDGVTPDGQLAFLMVKTKSKDAVGFRHWVRLVFGPPSKPTKIVMTRRVFSRLISLSFKFNPSLMELDWLASYPIRRNLALSSSEWCVLMWAYSMVANFDAVKVIWTSMLDFSKPNPTYPTTLVLQPALSDHFVLSMILSLTSQGKNSNWEFVEQQLEKLFNSGIGVRSSFFYCASTYLLLTSGEYRTSLARLFAWCFKLLARSVENSGMYSGTRLMNKYYSLQNYGLTYEEAFSNYVDEKRIVPANTEPQFLPENNYFLKPVDQLKRDIDDGISRNDTADDDGYAQALEEYDSQQVTAPIYVDKSNMHVGIDTILRVVTVQRKIEGEVALPQRRKNMDTVAQVVAELSKQFVEEQNIAAAEEKLEKLDEEENKDESSLVDHGLEYDLGLMNNSQQSTVIRADTLISKLMSDDAPATGTSVLPLLATGIENLPKLIAELFVSAGIIIGDEHSLEIVRYLDNGIPSVKSIRSMCSSPLAFNAGLYATAGTCVLQDAEKWAPFLAAIASDSKKDISEIYERHGINLEKGGEMHSWIRAVKTVREKHRNLAPDVVMSRRNAALSASGLLSAFIRVRPLTQLALEDESLRGSLPRSLKVLLVSNPIDRTNSR